MPARDPVLDAVDDEARLVAVQRDVALERGVGTQGLGHEALQRGVARNFVDRPPDCLARIDVDTVVADVTAYPGGVKEFWIYTALRLGLFVGAFCIVFGLWFLVADTVNVLLVIVVAFLVSGIASYLLLERQRNAFAVKVEGRAGRITDKYEEMRTKEDED